MEGTIVAMVEAEVDTAEAEAIKDVVVEAEEDVVAIRTTVEVVAVAMEATKIEVTAVHLVVGEEAEVAAVVAVDRFGLIVGTMMTMRVTVMMVETGAAILITIAGAVAAMVAATAAMAVAMEVMAVADIGVVQMFHVITIITTNIASLTTQSHLPTMAR